jgi:hypothetical protein
VRHVAVGALSDSAEHIDVRHHFNISILKVISVAVARHVPLSRLPLGGNKTVENESELD